MGKRPLITITVGHTIERPGALAVSPLSCHEFEYNKHLATIIAEAIGPDFVHIILFRGPMGIEEVYRRIGNLSPDANIELHFNSASAVEAYGTETLCSEKDVPFATMVQTALCEALGRDVKGNRGVKVLRSPDDRGYISVSRLRVPSIIIEPFFGSNTKDAELGKKGHHLIAGAIKKALDVWFLWDVDSSE
jgi:N-acetylmuramoyl-L-alanine amidase